LRAFSPRLARLESVDDTGSVVGAEPLSEGSDNEVCIGGVVDEVPASNDDRGSVVEAEDPVSRESGSAAGVVAPDSGLADEESPPESADISGSLVAVVDGELLPSAASSAVSQDWAAVAAGEVAAAGDWLCAAVACWTASGFGVPPMGLTDMGLQTSREVILYIGARRPNVELRFLRVS
jgi:hypothetical protein